MPVRGVRGATTIARNEREEIIAKTRELLEELLKRNGISVDDVASAIFSVTDDVDAEFPAVAARALGWIYTPLMCVREIPVKGSLQACIRVLLHVNAERPQKDFVHVYLYDAKKLRPDLDAGEKDRYYVSNE